MYKALIFAGPNGSGKSSATEKFPVTGVYVNADDLKKLKKCSDQEATIEAENICRKLIEMGEDFTFETVLSSQYKIGLLKYARSHNYRITTIYVTTNDPEINIRRVHYRVEHGGHPVPDETVRNRYYKSMANLPEIVALSDRTLVYDNTGDTPQLICEADSSGITVYETEHWTSDAVLALLRDNKEEYV